MLTPSQRRLLAVRNWPLPVLLLIAWFPFIALLFSEGFLLFLVRLHKIFVVIFSGKIFCDFDIKMTGALDEPSLQKGCAMFILFSLVTLPYGWLISMFLGENYSRFRWILLIPYIFLAYIALLLDFTIVTYLMQYACSMGLAFGRIMGLLFCVGMGGIWFFSIKHYMGRLYGVEYPKEKNLVGKILIAVVAVVLSYFSKCLF